MCWNCGCMIPDSDMGDPDNITTAKLRDAAKAGANKNIHELMQNVQKTYKSLIENTPEDRDPLT